MFDGTDYEIALMTFSVLKAPYGDSSVQAFDDHTPDTFTEAEGSEGFIDRAKPVDDTAWMTNYQKDWGLWGPFAVPRFYGGGTCIGSTYQAQTLSIWRDLHSVWRFTYRGAHHRLALKRSKEWFGPQGWPIYVIWWIRKDYKPTWPEACLRLEHLHDHGPTPHAFTFRCAFDPAGQNCSPKSRLPLEEIEPTNC